MVISPKTLAPAQIVTSFKMVGCRLMFCEDFTFLLPNPTSLNKLQRFVLSLSSFIFNKVMLDVKFIASLDASQNSEKTQHR